MAVKAAEEDARVVVAVVAPEAEVKLEVTLETMRADLAVGLKARWLFRASIPSRWPNG